MVRGDADQAVGIECSDRRSPIGKTGFDAADDPPIAVVAVSFTPADGIPIDALLRQMAFLDRVADPNLLRPVDVVDLLDFARLEHPIFNHRDSLLGGECAVPSVAYPTRVFLMGYCG